MNLNLDEIEAAGLDPKTVESIARRIERVAMEADALGITIFGGSSSSLRFDDRSPLGPLILTHLKGSFDGGCGAYAETSDGLIPGE